MPNIDALFEYKTAIGGLIAFSIGAAIKIYDTYVKKKSNDALTAHTLRDELWTEIRRMTEIISRLEVEVEQWKTKYWEEKESHLITRKALLSSSSNNLHPEDLPPLE